MASASPEVDVVLDQQVSGRFFNAACISSFVSIFVASSIHTMEIFVW